MHMLYDYLLVETFTLQFTDYVNMKPTANSFHDDDDDDIDEDGYTDMSNLSLPISMASSGNSKKSDDTIMDQQGQVEVLTQMLQKLKANETRECNKTASPTMAKHERPNLDYLMQQAARSST